MSSGYTACPHCGFLLAPGRIRCKQCQKLITDPVAASEPRPVDQVLQEEIQRQVRAGWTLTGQTSNSATFTRKGDANPLAAIFLFLLAILPGILYVLLARPTLTLYVVVAPDGKITRTEGRS